LSIEIEEDLLYRPKSKETRLLYEQMLYIVQKHMGDHSLEVMKGALDEVLAILKAEGMTDRDRKQEIEILLEKIDDSEFNTLTVLGQQLTDYF
jgi:pre-mRNA-splicing helicase BRR2